MSRQCCCRVISPDTARSAPLPLLAPFAPPVAKTQTSRPLPLGQRRADATGWLLTAITVALIPKCPACLAAWLALATGLGISISAAARLRIGLQAACAVAVMYLVARFVRQHNWRERHS